MKKEHVLFAANFSKLRMCAFTRSEGGSVDSLLIHEPFLQELQTSFKVANMLKSMKSLSFGNHDNHHQVLFCHLVIKCNQKMPNFPVL